MVSREDDSTDVVSRARQALADYTSRLGQRVPAAGLIAELAAEVERLSAPQQRMCAACEVLDDCPCLCHLSDLT